MLKRPAVLGSALFVLVGPVLELGVGPWALTGLRLGDDLPGWWGLRTLGALLVVGGAGALVDAFARFALEGGGTPSPLAPPRRPVTGGVYGWTRHPMYVATTVALIGEALLLRQAILLVAAALYAATLGLLVHFREEPLLRQRFGEDWRAGRGGG